MWINQTYIRRQKPIFCFQETSLKEVDHDILKRKRQMQNKMSGNIRQCISLR